jgi:hypothetical protein
MTPKVIDSRNVLELGPLLLKAVKSADTICIDCEFTGLGRVRANVRDQNLEVRYKVLRDIVNDFSLLSLGICCQVRSKGESWRVARFSKDCLCVQVAVGQLEFG